MYLGPIKARLRGHVTPPLLGEVGITAVIRHPETRAQESSHLLTFTQSVSWHSNFNLSARHSSFHAVETMLILSP